MKMNELLEKEIKSNAKSQFIIGWLKAELKDHISKKQVDEIYLQAKSMSNRIYGD